MAGLGHDAVFVEEAAALRPRLESCARVLYPRADGDTGRADRAVDEALARTYALQQDADRTIAAFRALLHPTWTQDRRTALSSLGRSAHPDGERVELVDLASVHGGDLAEGLAALGPTSEAVVVLSLLGGLTPTELGRVVGAPATRVTELFGEAISRLARTDPARRDPTALTIQLARLAGPPDPAASARAGVGDLARGRRIEQRGRRRRGVLAAAALAVVALVAGLAVRGIGEGQVANVPSSPTPTPSSMSDPRPSPRCDLDNPDCRSLTLIRWRSQMSEVIVQHLDGRRRYFSDMSWGIWTNAQSESFWRGRGGALSVGLSRMIDGGTEVSLQIATDTAFADKCGRQIKQRCRIFQSMDGNVYLIGGDSTSTGGVEVQFAADEDRVITVVARNTSDGKTIDVDSSDLISLVKDSRLRLPRR